MLNLLFSNEKSYKSVIFFAVPLNSKAFQMNQLKILGFYWAIKIVDFSEIRTWIVTLTI